MQKEETLMKELRLLSESDWTIFECLKQFVELFVQKQNFCDHRPEAICMVVLACLWATEVSEFLGPLTCFWVFERFLRQKVMNHESDVSEKPLRDSYKCLERKLVLFLDLILKISVPVCSEILSIIGRDLWVLRICYKELRAGYPLCIQF